MVIISSIIAFTLVILLLVFMLLLAQKKLVQSGPVKISINGEKTVTVSAGSSLLSTLANEKIFLPSACGGGGTCAMCKCVVEAGGGDVLPTELGHLTRQRSEEHTSELQSQSNLVCRLLLEKKKKKKKKNKIKET